jgi:hypothetical protein
MTSTETRRPPFALDPFYLRSGPYSWDDLSGNPVDHLVISGGDFISIVAFWIADEALIDSDVAYPDCPPGSDPDEGCGECWDHQPLKSASGQLFSTLCETVLGSEVAARLFERMRSAHEDVVASLLAIGVRVAS